MTGYVDPKILIIEDRSIIAADIYVQLLKMKFSVAGSTSSIDQLFQMINQTVADVIVMNIGNKEPKKRFSGIEILQAKYGIPVVVITAGLNPELFQQLMAVSPCAVVPKPFDAVSLRRGIVAAQHYIAARKFHDLVISDRSESRLSRKASRSDTGPYHSDSSVK